MTSPSTLSAVGIVSVMVLFIIQLKTPSSPSVGPRFIHTGNDMFVNAAHPAKAVPPIVVADGKIISVKRAQFPKAVVPIASATGSEISVNSTHPTNAFAPTVVTAGIVAPVSFIHPDKIDALNPVNISASKNSNFSQDSNAFGPMVDVIGRLILLSEVKENALSATVSTEPTDTPVKEVKLLKYPDGTSNTELISMYDREAQLEKIFELSDVKLGSKINCALEHVSNALSPTVVASGIVILVNEEQLSKAPAPTDST